MKNIKKIIALICLLLLSVALLSACNPSKPVKINKKQDKFVLDENKYELSFEDNFNSLDTSKWNIGTFDSGMRRAGYYTNDADTLFCEDGNLVMKAIKKNGKYGEGIYTSWLTTSKNYYGNSRTEDYIGFTQKYGYFEVRCIPLKGVGVWSAFWMMPDSANTKIGSSDGAEIDIMESHYWPQNEQTNVMAHAIHVDESLDNLKSATSKSYIIDDFYEEFHTFAMMWTPTEYVFYIDGYETWRTKHYKGVSEVEQYLKLTVEVSGFNDGSKPTQYGTNEHNNPLNNDWSSSEIKLVVDYVKAYKYLG